MNFIGFACAYTPITLIHAGGYVPYRIFPIGEYADQAGHILHDNLCPHVKKILDRIMQNDIPEMKSVVFMNSCDAMRRLADAWQVVRAQDNVVILDLPVIADEGAINYFAQELEIFRNVLATWRGTPITLHEILESIKVYNRLEERIRNLKGILWSSNLQLMINRAVTEPPEHLLDEIISIEGDTEKSKGIPVILFGNVLPDPDAISFIETCGVKIISEDLCTGSRQFYNQNLDEADDLIKDMSKAILKHSPCARTIDPSAPGRISQMLSEKVIEYGAKGVIGHLMKFCDPYASKIPVIRENLTKLGVPLLILEGDCTLNSIGQNRTRIEAFVELLQ